jgi:replicative DNA helicase
VSANRELEVINAACINKDFHVILEEDAGQMFETYRDVIDHMTIAYSTTKSIPTVAGLVSKFKYFKALPPEDISATKYHLAQLRDEYKAEKLDRIIKDAYERLKTEGVDDAMYNLDKNMARLSKNSVVVHDLNVTDVDATVRYFRKLRDIRDSHDGDIGIKIGIPEFDFCLPMGISTGMYGIIMAFPAVGKSWMTQYMAVQAWKKGRRPMIISAEMTETEVRNRLITIIGEGKWSHRELSGGMVDIDAFEEWGTETLEGKQDFVIISNEGIGAITPAAIRAKIEQYQPDIVFVDYLQLMDDGNRGGGRTENIVNVSIEMKRIALSTGVPIVAIVSATPEKDQRTMETPPELSQTGWARQIAYDADWAIAIGREKNSDQMEVVFRKNRNGMMGDFVINVDFDRGIWKSAAF